MQTTIKTVFHFILWLEEKGERWIVKIASEKCSMAMSTKYKWNKKTIMWSHDHHATCCITSAWLCSLYVCFCTLFICYEWSQILTSFLLPVSFNKEESFLQVYLSSIFKLKGKNQHYFVVLLMVIYVMRDNTGTFQSILTSQHVIKIN